jgi:hypothetical protein
MNIKTGFELCKKFILPALQKIIKSLIKKSAKAMYEKLYLKFCDSLVSFETAISKALKETDPKKLQKNIACIELGLNFYEKVHETLEGVLPDYAAMLVEAKERLNRISEGV